MMNPFPIMFLALLAHAILRVVTGLLLVYFGIRHFKTQTTHPNTTTSSFLTIALAEIVIGIQLTAGFYTQIAALALLCYSLLALGLERRLRGHVPPRATSALLIGISLSLFITGAGAFAFDLPF